MGPLDLLLHLLNFAAPAACVALLIASVSRIFMKKSPLAYSWWAQAAINFIVGLVTLTAGLWLFGRDGKMASYAALVVCNATSQWWMLRRG